MRRVREYEPWRRGRPRPAFSLVELLFVILILGVLVALLVPGLTAAWDICQMTHCKTNLHTIFKAQGVWRADHDNRLLVGPTWRDKLLYYVDGREDVFQCQTRGEWRHMAEMQTEAETPPGGGVRGGGGTQQGAGTATSEWDPSVDEMEGSFEFDVYFQEGSNSVYHGGSDTGKRGAFVHSIPLGEHPWVQRTVRGSYVNYKIDDEGCLNQGKWSYDDLECNVYYDGDRPTRIKILKASGAGSGSVAKRFIIDFKIAGKVIIRDLAGEEGNSGDDHYGEVIELEAEEGTFDTSAAEPEWRLVGSTWKLVGGTMTPTVYGDYALNAGTYERYENTFQGPGTTGVRFTPPKLDEKMPYILDYGAGKFVADFNNVGLGVQPDDFDKYFITDIEQWQEVYGTDGQDWRAFQALRHFGKANVLFCDGHVESLTAEELEPSGYTDPRWVYLGR